MFFVCVHIFFMYVYVIRVYICCLCVRTRIIAITHAHHRCFEKVSNQLHKTSYYYDLCIYNYYIVFHRHTQIPKHMHIIAAFEKCLPHYTTFHVIMLYIYMRLLYCVSPPHPNTKTYAHHRCFEKVSNQIHKTSYYYDLCIYNYYIAFHRHTQIPKHTHIIAVFEKCLPNYMIFHMIIAKNHLPNYIISHYICYRVAKTRRIPYLYRSFSAKEPYI